MTAFRGAERCMINRPLRRTLTDGCDDCGRSLTLCQALADMERRRCCDACSHE